MKQCQRCGENLGGKSPFCQVCGSDVSGQTNSYFNNQNTVNSVNDDLTFGFGLIGFFVPVAGFVMYVILQRTSPNRAKACLIGAVTCIVSVMVSVIIVIICYLITINQLLT